MFGWPYKESDGGREVALEQLPVLVSESAIKRLREERGLSQHGLGRVSGVSQAVISRIESGDAPLSGDVAGKLAAALKVDRGELALAEGLAQMAKLAVKGQLRPEVPAGVALRLIESDPPSEAARRLGDAALEALVEIAETASANWSGMATKSDERWAKRDLSGRRLDKPHDPRGAEPGAGEPAMT
jgi:transcriptional regulator with XRE-family HTH domain